MNKRSCKKDKEKMSYKTAGYYRAAFRRGMIKAWWRKTAYGSSLRDRAFRRMFLLNQQVQGNGTGSGTDGVGTKRKLPMMQVHDTVGIDSGECVYEVLWPWG
jgi:phosphoribosylaminoimidazole (AIR) synthetase